jgi:hypothetical protein
VSFDKALERIINDIFGHEPEIRARGISSRHRDLCAGV